MASLRVLTIFLAVSAAKGDLIKDNIKTLEHLLMSFNTALTVNAFVCWESGMSEL